MNDKNKSTSFKKLALLFKNVENTNKRNKKKRLIGQFLLKINKDEIQPTVTFLTGKIFPESDPRVLDVGGQTLFNILESKKQATLAQKPLTILELEKYFNEIAQAAGKDSRNKKKRLIRGLLNQTDQLETKYIVRLLLREMRIGVVEGIALEAISEASDINVDLIRRGNMLLGNLGEVAEIALKRGKKEVAMIDVRLFTPVKPMLAEVSHNVNQVFLKNLEKIAFEFKFDGARVQIHKKDTKIKIFSRRLTDITESLPDIVEIARHQIKATDVLLDGEVIAIGNDAKPLPFQDLMKRLRRRHDIDKVMQRIPLKLYLFDVLFINNRSLIETPYNERWKVLTKICSEELLTERIITNSLSEAEKFLNTALKAGHEGLVSKELGSYYTPGARGKKWFKIKSVDHLDLVIIAADWGSGRRREWLSNYHLAARDETTGNYLDLGKTFKGLTDHEFKELTKQLQTIRISENQYTVFVKPEIVVEVAYNEIQQSSHYNSGFALRFARINRIRYDKGPKDVDTIKKIKALYRNKFKYKAKLET
ncbi:MAG: ATP-dependent DNA ligase [Candidatus Bathyarchaeota archaeon]|nr:MAG: ATP-dependent DNA ligase [Candidatus Bathyarchaeota archaeon]